jgi:hypothetical protein
MGDGKPRNELYKTTSTRDFDQVPVRVVPRWTRTAPGRLLLKVGVFTSQGPKGIVITSLMTAALVFTITRSWGLAVFEFALMVVVFSAQDYSGAQWQLGLSRVRLYVPMIVFLIVYFAINKTLAGTSFFQVSSQVIVVLILALAVQQRALDLKVLRKGYEMGAVAVTIFLLTVGEYWSLRSLIDGGARPIGTTSAAIAAGLAGVLVGALAGGSEGGHSGGESS